MFRAFVFDLDGTLINSLNANYKAIRGVLLEEGVKEFTYKEFMKYNGSSNEEIFSAMKKKYKITTDIERLMERKFAFFSEYEDEVVLNKKAKEVLIKLKERGFKLALASSSRMIYISHFTNRFNLWKFFNIIIGCDELQKSKPDPEIFLKAAYLLRVDPEDSVLVEDSVNGVIAGKRAGMKVVAVNFTTDETLLRNAGADIIIKSFDELLDIHSFKHRVESIHILNKEL